jgi:hypothetical protein
MNVVPPLVADSQAPIATEPGQGALDHPAVSSQPLTGFDTSPGDASLDPTSTQHLATLGEIVPLVSMQLVGSLPRSAPRASHWLDSVQHLLQHHRVVDVRSRQSRREWDTLTLDHKVALRPRFASVRRIRPGFATPPGAATLAESSEARDQSILSASPSRCRSNWCSLCQTLASLQSRSLRQQVIPLPQPISSGSICQGRPVLRTNRMPVNVARSGILGRPPFGLGRSGGRIDSISRHSPSGSTSFAIPKVYRIKTGFVRCSKSMFGET